ncbi:MAG: hypothetical protein HC936_09040 [Leptolyngbyaceae cyanobacterium SU_3_3]|nr:hypothetical protein [Leptolyngbyaceae cyanobacterium SU_3_3]
MKLDSTIAGSALPLVLSDVSVEPISLPLPLVSSEKVTTRQNASIQQLRSHSPNSIDQRQQPVFSPPDRQAAAQLNELDKPINLSHAPSNLAHAVSDSANLFINSTSESTLALNKLNVQPTQIQLPLSLPTSQSEGVQFITLVPPHDRALSPELHPKLQRSDFVVDRSILDSTDRPILRNLQSSNLPTDRASTTLSPQPTSGLSTVETQGQGQQGILLPRKPLGSVDRLPPELIVDRSVVNAIDRSASDFVVDRPVTNAIDRLISNSVDRLPSELIVDRSILDSVDLSISNSVANRQNTFDRPVIVSQSSILGLPAPDEVAPPATQPPKLPTQLPTQPPPTRTNSDRAQPPTPSRLTSDRSPTPLPTT